MGQFQVASSTFPGAILAAGHWDRDGNGPGPSVKAKRTRRDSSASGSSP